MGGVVEVERLLRDQTPGCSIPCILCRKELERFDVRVECVIVTGERSYSWRIRAPDSPVSVFTSLQKRQFTRQPAV